MALQFLQDPTKTQQFQQGILRLVGDELVSEFHLTRADRPDSARSQVLRMLHKLRVLFCGREVHPPCSKQPPKMLNHLVCSQQHALNLLATCLVKHIVNRANNPPLQHMVIVSHVLP